MDNAQPPEIVALIEPDTCATQRACIGAEVIVLSARGTGAWALRDEAFAALSIKVPCSRIPLHCEVATIPLAAALVSDFRPVEGNSAGVATEVRL